MPGSAGSTAGLPMPTRWWRSDERSGRLAVVSEPYGERSRQMASVVAYLTKIRIPPRPSDFAFGIGSSRRWIPRCPASLCGGDPATHRMADPTKRGRIGTYSARPAIGGTFDDRRYNRPRGLERRLIAGPEHTTSSAVPARVWPPCTPRPDRTHTRSARGREIQPGPAIPRQETPWHRRIASRALCRGNAPGRTPSRAQCWAQWTKSSAPCTVTTHGGLAQPGRALESHSRGRGFESLTLHQLKP